jgi:GAF domain-containing protein
VLAAGVTALSVLHAVDSHASADERAVATASERLSTELATSVALLGGSDVMALDGTVDPDEFAAFSADVLPGSMFSALAYAEPVPGSDRAAWETTNDSFIKDTDGAGDFVPAQDRQLHVVVRLTEPATEASRRVLGFDMMSDGVRASGITQASGSDGVAVVGPIRLAGSGLPGVFLVNAVHDASGDVVGYVASGLSVQDIVDRVEPGSGLDPIAVSIDGTYLTTTRDGSAVGTFELAGRSFEVSTGTQDGVDWTLTVAAAAAFATLVVLAVVTGRRARHARLRSVRRANRSQELALLAERLSHARSPAEVLDIVVADAARPVACDHVDTARKVRSRPGQIEVHDATQKEPVLLPLGARTPLTDCVRGNRVVEVWNTERQMHAFADVAPGDDVMRWCSVLCVPITVGNASVGAMCFGWSEVVDEADRSDVRSAAELIAEMAGRAFERGLGRQLLQERLEWLNEFSAQLAAAHALDDIARAVETLVPAILGVDAALLGDSAATAHEPDDRYSDGPTDSTGEAADDLADGGVEDGDPAYVRICPLAGDDSLRLELHLDDPSQWTPTVESASRAVLDLLASAVARARRSEDERTVLQRLQQALLTPPPLVDGYDIAVSYESAMQSVGIGGDWYSVVDSERALFLVIGDVAGHGPGAVAIMAQVKTVIRHLLTVDAPIETALHQASTLLEDRNAYASAIILRIDKVTGVLTFVNAGHPFPLVRRGDDVEVLSVVHRPWLGVAADVARPSSTSFDVGSTLLLYTDGLVEERHTNIDVSIEQLAVSVGHSTTRAAALVSRLALDRAEARGPLSPDDDIALVAVTRTGTN